MTDDVIQLKRPRGRPMRKGPPRHFLHLRLPMPLKDRLVAAALAHDDPLTQEITRRLERSFWEDEVGLPARLRLEALEELGRIHCPSCAGSLFALHATAAEPVTDIREAIAKVECAGCHRRFKVRFRGR